MVMCGNSNLIEAELESNRNGLIAHSAKWWTEATGDRGVQINPGLLA